MTHPHDVAVILPALNERLSVEAVVKGFRSVADRVVVVDNGSEDGTAEVAKAAGAEVAFEPVRGYGRACLAGIHYLRETAPRTIAFADCDGTFDAGDLPRMLEPIETGAADFVQGRRSRAAPGSFTWWQRAGTLLVALAIRGLYGIPVIDVSPFKAVRGSILYALRLREPNYGFPVELLVRAARAGARFAEVDVSYVPRAHGQSKVASSPTASLLAGLRLLWVAVGLRIES